MCFCGASHAIAQDLLSSLIKPLQSGECAEGVQHVKDVIQNYFISKL